MKRHINIPIFIPHLGCPNNCVFCNQHSISGHGAFDIKSVKDELWNAISTVDYENSEVEIAFFGGSFTGIDRSDMLFLLSLAKECIDLKKAQSIRLSTRPDYIDDEILDILKEYRVTDIELGLQSMDDAVLSASKRGHSADTARKACKMIKEHGFTLVGQMMIGLPGSTLEKEVATAVELSTLCDAARIYPTVVFCDTELDEMRKSGDYTPLSHDEAIARTKEALSVFVKAKKPVIRVGLCASESLEDPEKAVAGATHPALGELVYSAYYMRLIREYIEAHGLRSRLSGKDIIIKVPKGEISKASGHKKENKKRLQSEFGVRSVRIVEDSSLESFKIEINLYSTT